MAIMKIIKTNPNIFRDTTLDYLGSSPLLDSSNCATCSAGENYYNDIKHYVTINVSSGKDTNEYTFRYYGADEGWKISNYSTIFICYAFDNHGNGGSEGDGKISKKQAELFTKLFEKELVDKIDKELKLARIEKE